MPIKDCPPFSPCFCASHPNVKQCQTADLNIDSEIWFLIWVGIIFAFIVLYNKNKSIKHYK